MKKKFFKPNLNNEQKAFYKVKLYEMILALVFILFGIIMLINNIVSDKLVAISLGLLMVADGAINIYSNFMKYNDDNFKLNLIFGCIYIVIALLLFTNIIKFVNYIQIYYSLYLIVSGIKQTIIAIKLKLINDKSFLLVLLMGILIIALGGLLMFYPYVSFTIFELFAIFSILYGLLNLNTSNLLKNRADVIIE